MKTELNGYTLWWDGTIEVPPAKIQEMVMAGVNTDNLAVSADCEEVQQFNRLAAKKILVGHTLDLSKLDHTWDIPEPYSSMDIDKYVLDVLVPRVTLDRSDERFDRIALELEFYMNHGYYDLLRTLIYIVDTFRARRVVWGVGRGSSCASYLLYLIGLHSVDPIKYGIPLDEFFK